MSGANIVKGEGAGTDTNHTASKWIPLYDLSYKVYGRDKLLETGRTQNLAQMAFKVWKEAMNNGSIELFQAISSGAMIESATIHFMGKDEKTGEPKAHYKFVIEDGNFGTWGFEERKTDKGVDMLEVLEFTGKIVSFKQEILGKGDSSIMAAYDFSIPNKVDGPRKASFDGVK
jgi:hypothetical protein